MNNNIRPLTIVNVPPTNKRIFGIPAQTFFSKYARNENPTVEKLISPIPTSNEITNV